MKKAEYLPAIVIISRLYPLVLDVSPSIRERYYGILINEEIELALYI